MTLFCPKMPKLEKPCLLSSLPKFCDTILVNKNLADVIVWAKHAHSRPIYQKLASSGLLEAATFPTAIGCPELVVECANHYDPNSRCVKKIFEEVVVRINRASVCSTLKIPHKEPYKP